MDPDFAAAFSSEYPEAYREAVRGRRKHASDAAIAIHVPMIPQRLSRFAAGVAVMLLLIGAFYVASQTTDSSTVGIPSGQLLSSEGGMSFSMLRGADRGISTLADPNNDLGQKIAPIRDASRDFFGNRVN